MNMPSDSINMANALNISRECNNLRLEEHMRFICPECGKENNTQQEWRRHLNVQHCYSTKTVQDFDFKEIDEKYHECQICMKWVANAHQAIALLQYHRFLHLPYARTYRCRHCPGSFTRKRALCEHLYRFHNRLITKLENDRKVQELRRATNDKDPKHNKEFYMKFLCPLCGKVFDRFIVWQQHIDAAHSATSVDLRMHRIQSTTNYFCAQCSCTLKDGPSKDQLQRHHFTHLPFPQYFLCVFCSTRKCYKSELFLHFIKSHTQEYIKYKVYIRKPVEWGGQPNENVVKELQQLLGQPQPTKQKQTDILQRALQNSFINLEEEVDKEVSTVYNHEFALDQSLKELDDILNSEIDPNLQLKESNLPVYHEVDDDELEDICKEFFVEIEDHSTMVRHEVQDNPNRKRLKLDLSAPENAIKINSHLQKEMQKYINYLCPECGCEFDSQSVWRTHVFEQHNLANAVDTKFRAFNSQKTSYLCLVCYQVQRTVKHSELRRHHFQHMPYQAYLKCAICTKTKSSKPKMLQHLQYAHYIQIQKSSISANTSSKTTAVKTLRCLDCDKMYAQQTRFNTHLRQCPQRLQPLAVGQYDIAKNMKLLDHLQAASKRIGKLLQDEGIDASNMKLPFK